MPRVIPAVFRFTQATPSATWNIQHNLGSNGSKGVPIVDTFINVAGVPTKIIPASVHMVDANNITILFSVARTGFAVITA
jgi:hypothetical protein